MTDLTPKEIKQEVYARVIEAFASIGITVQTEIAAKIGVERQKLQDWKQGKSDPRDWIVEISEITGRSLKWLLTGEDEEQGEDQGFRDSPFYRLYIASKKAEPEDLGFIKDFIEISLKRLEDRSEHQVNKNQKSRPK